MSLVRHHLLRLELSSSAASKRVSPLCSSSQVLFLALSSKLTFTIEVFCLDPNAQTSTGAHSKESLVLTAFHCGHPGLLGKLTVLGPGKQSVCEASAWSYPHREGAACGWQKSAHGPKEPG